MSISFQGSLTQSNCFDIPTQKVASYPSGTHLRIVERFPLRGKLGATPESQRHQGPLSRICLTQDQSQGEPKSFSVPFPRSPVGCFPVSTLFLRGWPLYYHSTTKKGASALLLEHHRNLAKLISPQPLTSFLLTNSANGICRVSRCCLSFLSLFVCSLFSCFV